MVLVEGALVDQIHLELGCHAGTGGLTKRAGQLGLQQQQHDRQPQRFSVARRHQQASDAMHHDIDAGVERAHVLDMAQATHPLLAGQGLQLPGAQGAAVAGIQIARYQQFNSMAIGPQSPAGCQQFMHPLLTTEASSGQQPQMHV